MPGEVLNFRDPIGLFPLPNAVLFPRTTLPLQVFEQRYRVMVRDALADQRLIAMALLLPGYEAKYYTNVADISPIVCVGRIREHVQGGDGRYFINLLGLCRARILHEDREGEYRQALLEPLWPQGSGVEMDGEFAARRTLEQLLSAPEFESFGTTQRCRNAVNSSAPLSDVVDMIAGGLLPAAAIDVRQVLLEETDVLRRAGRLARELNVLRLLLDSQNRSHTWPHTGSSN